MTKQAEKALRDAGWEQVTRSDVEPGEEYYDLQAGWATKAGHALDGVPMPNYIVLRAPRPEPEYEPGTVVWGLVGLNTSGPQALIRQDDDEYPWVSVYLPYSIQGAAWRNSAVKVLRVIAYPDGSTPGESVMTKGVTRVEVIDDTGRAYVNTDAENVQVHIQDDGQTLKVLTGGTGVKPRPGDSFGKCDIDAINERADARARELLERFWETIDRKGDTK